MNALRLRYGLLLVSCCLLAFSCEKGEPECYEPVNILVRNQFVRKQVLEIDSLINDTTLLDTTIVRFVDTVLPAPRMFSLDMPQNIQVMGGNNISLLGVPLEPNIPSMRYAFQYDTSIAVFDTITYYYQTNIHFLSNACGYTNVFRIDSIHMTNNIVDSLAIVQPDIKSGNDKQVYFYFF